MNPQNCTSWLVVMVTPKILVSLLPWQLSWRVENPYSSIQNQNIKLIVVSSQADCSLRYNITKCLFHGAKN